MNKKLTHMFTLAREVRIQWKPLSMDTCVLRIPVYIKRTVSLNRTKMSYISSNISLVQSSQSCWPTLLSLSISDVDSEPESDEL